MKGLVWQSGNAFETERRFTKKFISTKDREPIELMSYTQTYCRHNAPKGAANRLVVIASLFISGKGRINQQIPNSCRYIHK